MEFASEAVKVVYERITPLIREIFGETITEIEGAPAWRRGGESTAVEVFVRPAYDGEAFVSAIATVNVGAEMTAELAQALLSYNFLSLCSFALDPNGRLVLNATILGSTADKAELRVLINAVLNEADRMDNLVKEKFGGVTLLDELQRAATQG